MNIANLPPGKYVVAVSGGIDSVVLLDVIAKNPDLELVVAHFDHGIRTDSADDATFVAELATRYRLPFFTKREVLGATASEEIARKTRYAFLWQTCKEFGAQAIITAHHEDDLLETAIINLQRGTGWRGLCSLRDGFSLRRPLLGVSKHEILKYANEHHLQWREDSTNSEPRYLRNRIRQNIMPTLSAETRQELLSLIARQSELRTEIEQLEAVLLTAITQDEMPTAVT